MMRTTRALLPTLAAAAVLWSGVASADPPPHAKAWGHSSRHDDDRDDVRRIYVVERLPRGYRYIHHRGLRYYYDRDGHWYRPYGGSYARNAPPVGLVIDRRGIAVIAEVPVVRW